MQMTNSEKSQKTKEHGKLDITIVVSGKPYEDKVKPDDVIRTAVEEALKKTKNTGQPIGNWVLTYGGNEINIDQTFAAAKIKDEATLFLNPRTGRGG